MGVSIQPQRSHRAQSLGLDPLARGRILLTTSNFPRWAGDSTTPFILNLAQDLQSLGWQVEVLAPHAPGAALHECLMGVSVNRYRYLWPETLETVCYQGGALVNLRRRPREYSKLPALVGAQSLAVVSRLLRGSYDLVHSHWLLPQGFVASLAAWPLAIPHVATVHGSDVFALRGSFLARCKRLALEGATAVTVNSSATEEAVRDLAPELPRLERIPMGVTERDPDQAAVADFRERHRRGKGPLLLLVGRIVEEKGIADLLRAVDLLAPRYPDLTAVIVGEGQERPAMQTLAQELGLSERVVFVGWVAADEIPSIMAAADIYVGPSRRGQDGTTEAQGLTFAEAMLAGTPVIATEIGGIVDAVRHEETGLLVAEQVPEQIAAAVERLVGEPNLGARLAVDARHMAQQRFTRQASADSFSNLFEGLLHGTSAKVRSKPPRSWHSSCGSTGLEVRRIARR